MKHTYIIEVNDDKRKGACDLEDWFAQSITHFKEYKDQHGNLRTLDANLKACEIKNTNEEIGDVITLKKDGAMVREWKDEQTMQLGKVSREISEEIEKIENE